ncbi:hypothetical protein MPER_12276 [Moniliophthora perniciosa FA553]|nr:hypothetical protein MPER_12276 [Moniliophthora perniciosa FA553]
MSFYNYDNCPSSSSMTLEQTSTTSSTLMSSYLTSPPSGAAIPLSPPDAIQAKAYTNSGSFGERRGYSYTIAFEATKPIGQAITAKGNLEPRAGALPRRTRKRVSAPPKISTTTESKSFDLFVESSCSNPSSDDSDNDE